MMAALRTLLCAALWLVSAHGSALAQTFTFPDTPELVRVISPPQVLKSGAYVGGEIVLKLQLLSKRPYEALSLELPDAFPGADMRQLTRPRTRFVRSYAGSGYIFETVIALYPETSGTLRMPEIRAAGAVAGLDEDADDVAFSVTLPPLEIRVHARPPGMTGEWWLVSPQVTITEALSKPEHEIRQGDVVRRTVTITAVGVPDEGLPRPEHGLGRGHSIIPVEVNGQTELSDAGTVGTVRMIWDLEIGQEAIVYVSPITVAYWDPVKGERQKVGVPGKRWEPLPLDRDAKAAALMAAAVTERQGWLVAFWLGIGAVALVVVAAAAWFAWQALPRPADRRLRQVCRDGASPAEAYRALARWQAETGLSPRDCAEILTLERALFASAGAPPPPPKVADAACALARNQRMARASALPGRAIMFLAGPNSTLW